MSTAYLCHRPDAVGVEMYGMVMNEWLMLVVSDDWRYNTRWGKFNEENKMMTRRNENENRKNVYVFYV